MVRDARFDLEALAVACDNDLGPYENILMQVRQFFLGHKDNRHTAIVYPNIPRQDQYRDHYLILMAIARANNLGTGRFDSPSIGSRGTHL